MSRETLPVTPLPDGTTVAGSFVRDSGVAMGMTFAYNNRSRFIGDDLKLLPSSYLSLFRKRILSMDKILLVDDLKQLREKKKGILASSRLHVLIASDGHEALAVARRELPNLIVMDHYLPNMDGVTCCREIKADPQLRHIPVIMMTNSVKSADFEGYLAAGANDCLAKPVDGKLFLSTIKKHLPAIESRGIRVPFCTEVRLIVEDGFHVGMTKDISPHGVFVTSELQPLPGDEMKFAFMLPGSDAPTEVRGKVAWFRDKNSEGKSGYNAGFGVEFLEITGKGIPSIRKSELEAFVSLRAGVVSADPVWT